MFQDLSHIREDLGIKSQIEKFQDEYYNLYSQYIERRGMSK